MSEGDKDNSNKLEMAEGQEVMGNGVGTRCAIPRKKPGFYSMGSGGNSTQVLLYGDTLEGSMRKGSKPTGQLQAEAELVRAGDEKGTNSKAIQDFRNQLNFMHMEVFAVCLRSVLGVGVCISVYLYAGQWSW